MESSPDNKLDINTSINKNDESLDTLTIDHPILKEPIIEKLNKIFTILIDNNIDIDELNDIMYDPKNHDSKDIDTYKNESYNLIKDIITIDEFNKIFNFNNIDFYYKIYIYYNYLKNNIDQLKRYYNLKLINHFIFEEYLYKNDCDDKIYMQYGNLHIDKKINEIHDFMIDFLKTFNINEIVSRLEKSYNMCK